LLRCPQSRERLLYLLFPIGLIVLWQVLLMLGIGDRRFILAPSDIAQRLVGLLASGELKWHVAVTLYRVLVGYDGGRRKNGIFVGRCHTDFARVIQIKIAGTETANSRWSL
jgi:hypothetical protein